MAAAAAADEAPKRCAPAATETRREWVAPPLLRSARANGCESDGYDD
jgi:hypothetical protein